MVMRAMLIKEFNFHLAWTDVMKQGVGYVGLIEYQRKLPGPLIHSLVQVLGF